jgi:5-methylcytosine-specific restriction protein B
MAILSPELKEAFWAWYKTDPHEELEDHYAGQLTKENLERMDRDEFIGFFFEFAREGGKIQSGGQRTAPQLRDSLMKNYVVIRPFLMEPFADWFDEIDWIQRSRAFTHFGLGFLTIYLNRINKTRFAIVNARSIEAMTRLGFKIPASKLGRYAPVRDAESAIMVENPDFKNFYQIDALTQFLIGASEGSAFLDPLIKPKSRDVSHWVYAPGTKAMYWEEYRGAGIMGVGWDELSQDLSGFSERQVREAYRKAKPDGSKADENGIVDFVCTLKPGDRIIAKKGIREVIGFGVVTSEYRYDPSKPSYRHYRHVNWIKTGSWRTTLGGRALPQKTLTSFAGLKLVRLLESLGGWPELKDTPSTSASVAEPGLSMVASKGAPAFIQRSFELLEGIWDNRTAEYYQSNKADFVRFVEEPFKEVFRTALLDLPEEITGFMETEKNLFSRFPKNDWGKGGAYPWYWGAIYPRGSRRVRGVQLYVTIDKRWLGIGFDASMDSESMSRLTLAINSNRSQILEDLSEALAGDEWKYGKHTEGKNPRSDDYPWITDDLAAWLDAFPDSKGRVLKVIKRDQLLALSIHELAQVICRAFAALFPLVQLSSGVEVLSVSTASAQMEFDSDLKIQAVYSSYSAEAETGFPHEEFEQWASALRRKKQAILYGPPGTGKTFMARKLANHLVGGTTGIVDLIQFHPSYAYEDFMQGLRPETRQDGQLAFRMKPGRFLDFCEEAKQRNGDPCVLIIDEINRANLSKVFGELMYLLEYREQSIPLSSGERFRIPDNALIIGTMNTADRSIALVDFALRRRFAFIKLEPNLDLLRHILPLKNPGFPAEKLIELIQQINAAIKEEGFHLGVTYFLGSGLADQIQSIWQNEIEPYLEEYFFAEPGQMKSLRWAEVRKALTE